MPCQGKNGTARSFSKMEAVDEGSGWRQDRGKDESITLVIIDKTIKRGNILKQAANV